MFKLTEAAVQVVAADSRAAVAEFDDTYITSLRLAANAAEGLKNANVPAGQTQRLFRTITESLEKIVEGRGSLVSAIGQLQVLHKHSNQAETDAGCPGGWGDWGRGHGFFTSARVDEETAESAFVEPQRA
jgi:hypothetical protein